MTYRQEERFVASEATNTYTMQPRSGRRTGLGGSTGYTGTGTECWTTRPFDCARRYIRSAYIDTSFTSGSRDLQSNLGTQ